MRISFLCLLTFVLCAAPASAQAARDTAFVDSLFRAHRYPVALRNGTLEGEGAAFLRDEARDAQFFMIAESHYVGEIPPFTAAWFNELHRTNGVNHFAIEYGPVIGRMLSAPGVRGNRQATFRLGARYPHAFQFWNDEELEAIVQMNAPVWGLDNEWGALHALDRLVRLATTDAARRAARTLAERVRAVEGTRPFEMAQVERFISGADSAEFDRLRDAFRPRRGSEAAELIDALELSNRIYLMNAAPGLGYRSNLEREEYMKRQFMQHYRRAQARGERLPKVLLKFGSNHGGKWVSRTNVHTIGNFLHEFAIANGTRSFHLVAWLVNEPDTYWSLTEEAAYVPLGRAGDPKGWYLVDFRPLRPLAHAGRLRMLSPELRQAIFGYDAVLLIGSGTRGTWDALREAAAR